MCALQNLNVTEIVVHEIFRKNDAAAKPPRYATVLEQLTAEAKIAFNSRVTNALSAQAKAIDMDIKNTNTDSFFTDAKKMAGHCNFLQESQKVVNRLNGAQMEKKTIPGGVLIVFKGTVGGDNCPFVGVMKAEMQDGFRSQLNGKVVTTEFIKGLFLTPATRLYKIGFMRLLNSQNQNTDEATAWRVIIYDAHIGKNNREIAAGYFYKDFMGCDFKEDSPYENKKFYEHTKNFINKNYIGEEKEEKLSALFTFMKEKTLTFTVDEYSSRYFMTADERDKYENFMRKKEFPERAVRRDLTALKGKLKKRRIKYGLDIELIAYPEAFEDGRITRKSEPIAGDENKVKTTIRIISVHPTEQ